MILTYDACNAFFYRFLALPRRRISYRGQHDATQQQRGALMIGWRAVRRQTRYEPLSAAAIHDATTTARSILHYYASCIADFDAERAYGRAVNARRIMARHKR